MRRRIATTIVIGWCSLAAGVLPAAAQQPVRSAPGGVLLNFQDADFGYVVATLAQAAGINFASSDLPQRPVSLRTTQAVSSEQIVELIRSLAQAYGVAITETSGFMRLQGVQQVAGEDPRQLYIYKLSHSRAPVLANTLQALFSGGVGGSPARAAQTQTLSQALRAQQQQQGGPPQPPQIVFTGGTGAVTVGLPVVIVPDEVTNALLVRATPGDWQIMQRAIQSLDLRPLQVVIEVVIAEVRHSRDLNLGTSLSATDTRARPGESTTGTLPGATGDTDFSLRLVRRGRIDVEATLSALAASGQVRILSRPVVQAQNNQEARISVGEQRPFVQISRSLPTTEPFRDEVIQYRDVATTLTILPTINDDGYVNLAVTQEVSHATSEVQFGAPIISTREATTQILALDGQTVVIGGLIDRQTERSRAGVPFLKDIPILGLLFGTTRENTGHSELFLFLTPHIVYTDQDADRVKREIEQNAELLAPLAPIQPLIPPAQRLPPPPPPLPPDTLQPAMRSDAAQR
jgi:general secretion pathway protein D